MSLLNRLGRLLLMGLLTCGVVAGLFFGGLALGFLLLKPERSAASAPSPLPTQPAGAAPEATAPPAAASPFTVEPILEVEYETLTPELARGAGLTVEAGALIRGLADAGRGAQAGLRVGDVIQAVNGLRLDNRHSLDLALIAQHGRGLVTLTVWRAGATLTLEINLVLRHDEVQG